MNNDSRVVNSIKNTTNGIISQVISVLANFIVRTIFLMYLNESYLGINGVFTNILTMLSLAELGFGATIIYSMYKPIAENDKEKLKALMLLYKKDVYKRQVLYWVKKKKERGVLYDPSECTGLYPAPHL